MKPERLKCPNCALKNNKSSRRMQPYGARRFKIWCLGCDRMFGHFGYFSRKTARQKAKKEIKDVEET